MATKAKGQAWLVLRPSAARNGFFFYEDELSGFQAAGHTFEALPLLVARWRKKSMCRIKCARSRRTLGLGLGKGAHFYVCGDAKRMAGGRRCPRSSKSARIMERWMQHPPRLSSKELRVQHRYQTGRLLMNANAPRRLFIQHAPIAALAAGRCNA